MDRFKNDRNILGQGRERFDATSQSVQSEELAVRFKQHVYDTIIHQHPESSQKEIVQALQFITKLLVLTKDASKNAENCGRLLKMYGLDGRTVNFVKDIVVSHQVTDKDHFIHLLQIVDGKVGTGEKTKEGLILLHRLFGGSLYLSESFHLDPKLSSLDAFSILIDSGLPYKEASTAYHGVYYPLSNKRIRSKRALLEIDIAKIKEDIQKLHDEGQQSDEEWRRTYATSHFKRDTKEVERLETLQSFVRQYTI